MQVGDKVYNFYAKDLGNFPIDIILVEGEITSVEEQTVLNIKNEEVRRTVVEIKCKHAGKKFLFDGIADKAEDEEGKYEWAVVYQNSDFFNIWYADEDNRNRCIESHLKEAQAKIEDRLNELKALGESSEEEQA